MARWSGVAAVGAGGAAGAVLRVAQAAALPAPGATLLVNLAGALALGAALPGLDPRGRQLLAVGLCGGYTTFSALGLEAAQLLAAGRPAAAGAYLAATGLGGLLAVAAGERLARGAAGARLGRWAPALLPLAALVVTLWTRPGPHLWSVRGALLVAGGGAGGALLRWSAALLCARRGWTGVPWATLGVNLLGCGLAGALAPRLEGPWRALVLAGALGGFTTFSTFARDGFDLLRAGRPRAALAYAAASLVGGPLAAGLGAATV